MSNGYDIELLFEQRLRQLGYRGLCRPAREDCGVDYVLFTTKGWVGIQVKAAKVNNRTTKTRGVILTNSLRAQLKGTNGTQRKRGREYYRACGVTVFALHDRGIFYLIPIEESGQRNVCCTVSSPFREAWHQVLGDPVEVLTVQQEELQEIRSLYESSESQGGAA